MTLLTSVERYLRRAAVAPSRFGREVAGDPRFVFDLRRGREPRASTAARVQAFIAAREDSGRDAARDLGRGTKESGTAAVVRPALRSGMQGAR